ncbi:hypothetical protein BDF22DRAFT_699693 [Syncephalis plumigaleata]|nr:hypothetical protein BDF22DRAFT_699693 [Syncephalis plumigaleata]
MQFSIISTLIKASAVATLLLAVTTSITEAAPQGGPTLQQGQQNKVNYKYYGRNDIYGDDGSHFKRGNGGFTFYSCDLHPDIKSNIGAAMSETREGASCNDDSIAYKRNTIYFRGA